MAIIGSSINFIYKFYYCRFTPFVKILYAFLRSHYLRAGHTGLIVIIETKRCKRFFSFAYSFCEIIFVMHSHASISTSQGSMNRRSSLAYVPGGCAAALHAGYGKHRSHQEFAIYRDGSAEIARRSAEGHSCDRNHRGQVPLAPSLNLS